MQNRMGGIRMLLGFAATAFSVACGSAVPSESPVQRERRNDNLDYCDNAPIQGTILTRAQADELTQIPNIRTGDVITLREGDALYSPRETFMIFAGESLEDLASQMNLSGNFEARVVRAGGNNVRLEFNSRKGYTIGTDRNGDYLYTPVLYELETSSDVYALRGILGYPFESKCAFSYTENHQPTP